VQRLSERDLTERLGALKIESERQLTHDAREAACSAQVDVAAALAYRDFMVSGYSDEGQERWLASKGIDLLIAAWPLVLERVVDLVVPGGDRCRPGQLCRPGGLADRGGRRPRGGADGDRSAFDHGRRPGGGASPGRVSMVWRLKDGSTCPPCPPM